MRPAAIAHPPRNAGTHPNKAARKTRSAVGFGWCVFIWCDALMLVLSKQATRNGRDHQERNGACRKISTATSHFRVDFPTGTVAFLMIATVSGCLFGKHEHERVTPNENAPAKTNGASSLPRRFVWVCPCIPWRMGDCSRSHYLLDRPDGTASRCCHT